MKMKYQAWLECPVCSKKVPIPNKRAIKICKDFNDLLGANCYRCKVWYSYSKALYFVKKVQK